MNRLRSIHPKLPFLSEAARGSSAEVEGSRSVPRHGSRSNLFATALACFLLLTAANVQAQLPAGTVDTTAPQMSPDTALLNQANKALEDRDYATALPLLTKLSAANPKDAHLLFDLGLTQDNLDHASEAAAAYRASAAADPKFASPHLALGLFLARDGKAAEARTEFQAAANLAGTAKDADTAGRALRALAKLDLAANAADARDELLAALKLSPETGDDILLSAEIADSLNDLPLAETAYRRFLAQMPNDPAATAALGHVLLQQKKAAEAEALLTNALTVHPGDTALTAQLCTVYFSEDDPAKSALAVPLAETLHQQHPVNDAVTRLLARLYAQTGKPESAAPLYAALLEKTPNDPTLLDDAGSNLIHLKRFAEAETLLKRAVVQPATAFPTPEDQAAAYSDLAFASSENNDPTVTLQAVELRAKVAPITAGSLFLLATAHDKLHQVKQASEAYKQFLAMANGKFPEQESEVKRRLITLEHMH